MFGTNTHKSMFMGNTQLPIEVWALLGRRCCSTPLCSVRRAPPVGADGGCCGGDDGGSWQFGGHAPPECASSVRPSL